MNVSLKWKIVGLLGLPVAAWFVYGALYLMGNWNLLGQANEVVANGKFIESNSELIHEVQLERARTALYLGDKIDISQLEEQQRVVLEKWSFVDATFQNVKTKKSTKDILDSTRKNLEEFRNAVKTKSILPAEATKRITDIVAQLIQVDILVASDE